LTKLFSTMKVVAWITYLSSLSGSVIFDSLFSLIFSMENCWLFFLIIKLAVPSIPSLYFLLPVLKIRADPLLNKYKRRHQLVF